MTAISLPDGSGSVCLTKIVSATFSEPMGAVTINATTFSVTDNDVAGMAVLSIVAIVVSGDYSQTNDCGPSLAAGSSCTITVTFAPTGAGGRIGSVIITDNVPGSPHGVSLSGTGSPTHANKPPTTAQATVVKELGPMISPAYSIVAGPDGNLWFTETGSRKTGTITPQGAVKEYMIATANSQPKGIVVGADGNLWFTES